jgi:4a-hydroxytetrahydrobiopterin dehydratase
MPRLTDAQVTEGLILLPGWRHDGDALVKQFAFPSFADAIAAVTRLAFEAEAADHHPDITIRYRRVTLAYATHSEGGITRKDLDGAAAAERLLGR